MSRSTNQEAFPLLETKRLILRQMRPKDAKAIFRMYGDEEVMRYRDVLAFTYLEEAQQFLEGCALVINRGRKCIGQLRSKERILSSEIVDIHGILAATLEPLAMIWRGSIGSKGS
jgi:RimJ/RimL family protein N-acetyltransferase